MNRIQHLTKSAKPAPPRPTFGIESGLFFASPAHDGSRVFFGPKHYEPNYAYPLVVWLHGAGCDERQLVRVMPTISLRNYVAVAPRGFRPSGESSNRPGYLWPQTDDCIEEAGWRISEAVAAARRKFHVARNRVFLAGCDAGGTMALRVAMSDPSRFAGALSVCGGFPHGHTPFHRLTDARRLPVFLAVGRDSREYPPDTACEDLRLLHAAGMSIILRQYPCGQELTEQMLRDVDRWIMEQIALSAGR
jgi:phospholipase/carboxylesterase